MTPFIIRDARWPEDEAVCISFIDALQKFEYELEPNRRIDPQVGTDYFAVLMKRVAEHDGRVFVAEQDGSVAGWAVFLVDDDPVYVVEEQRRTGLVAELFVTKDVRGTGIGKSLLSACAAEAQKRNLAVLMIGVLAKNSRARAVYLAAGFAPYAEVLRKHF